MPRLPRLPKNPMRTSFWQIWRTASRHSPLTVELSRELPNDQAGLHEVALRHERTFDKGSAGLQPRDVRSRGVVVRMITTLRGMRYGPGSSRKRHHDRGGPSRDTATSREREGSGQALRREPDDGPEVAQAIDHRRRPDGTQGGPLDRADARGGGDRRRLPAPYPAGPR